MYDEADVHHAAASASKTIGQLAVTLEDPEFKHDFGGPKYEIQDWIFALREMESMVEYILECTEENQQ